MNRYPAWKYILIGIMLLLGAIYTVPNLYGVVPVVQVAALRPTLKVDEALKTAVEGRLKEAKIPTQSTELEEGVLRLRFADLDAQRLGREAAAQGLPPGFVASLNLEPNTPHWMQWIHAKPMNLGLDLRGGVHFLLQVDMKGAGNRTIDRYLTDVRTLLRDKKIYYAGLARDGERIIVRFREKEQQAAALKAIDASTQDLATREGTSGDEGQIIVTVKPEVMKLDREQAIQQNVQTLRNRVNELGVSEPIVQQQGPDRILVQLAGVQDPARAEEIIGRTATLQMRLVSEENAAGAGTNAFAAYRDQPAPFGTEKFFDQEGNPVLVKREVLMTGERIKGAKPGFDERGSSAVNIVTDEAGGRILRNTTRENIRKRMAMMLIEKDKTSVLTWPVINGEFGSNFQITGMPDTTEANNLSLLLRAGSLSASMDIIEKQTIGPSLGADNIRKGYESVMYGFAAIAAFMILYYAMFGVISVISLGVNLLFLIGLLSGIQVTLTLPGMAAIALTLGMAIDANVLINERVREELRSGMTPQMAIQAGYERAFATILDSNVTTLIAGFALFAFGSGPVKGFAVVHCLGILTSIVSSVFVSRGIVNLIYGRKKVARLSIGNTSWDKKAAA